MAKKLDDDSDLIPSLARHPASAFVPNGRVPDYARVFTVGARILQGRDVLDVVTCREAQFFSIYYEDKDGLPMWAYDFNKESDAVELACLLATHVVGRVGLKYESATYVNFTTAELATIRLRTPKDDAADAARQAEAHKRAMHDRYVRALRLKQEARVYENDAMLLQEEAVLMWLREQPDRRYFMLSCMQVVADVRGHEDVLVRVSMAEVRDDNEVFFLGREVKCDAPTIPIHPEAEPHFAYSFKAALMNGGSHRFLAQFPALAGLKI